MKALSVLACLLYRKLCCFVHFWLSTYNRKARDLTKHRPSSLHLLLLGKVLPQIWCKDSDAEHTRLGCKGKQWPGMAVMGHTGKRKSRPT